MTKMSTDEKQNFLADLHVGVIAINESGRGALTVPVWYDYEVGGNAWFVTGENSLKGQLLTNGARMSLCAQTETAPYQYVSVEGCVTDIRPATEAELLAMAVRYLGEEQGTQYAQASGIEGQITVVLTPERWLAVDYSKR